MDNIGYPVEIVQESEHQFRAIFHDFDGTETCGDTEEEAMENAADLLETMVSSYITDQWDIPVPSDSQGRVVVFLDPIPSLKLSIYQAMRADGVTRAELARRLGWKWPQVDRLIDLRYNSRFDQLETAIKALGRRIVMRVEAA